MIVHGLGLNPQKLLKSLTLHDIKMNSDSLSSLLSYLQHLNPPNFKELCFSHLDISGNMHEIANML